MIGVNVVKMMGLVVVVSEVKNDGFNGYGQCCKNVRLSRCGQCGESDGFGGWGE